MAWTDYTTTGAGNYSAGATWVGGVAPATDGTDVRSVLFSHAVTMDVDCTIGMRGPGTPAGSSNVPGSSAVAGGGSLATATYRISFTNVDGSGNESGPSPEKTQAITSGQTLRITLPALPSGVTTRNIYLSTSATRITGKLYSTGHTGTTVDCTSASWTDGTTTEAAAIRLPIALRANANVTVSAGVDIVMKGDIALNDVNWSSGTGSLTFDPPSGKSYYFWHQLLYGGTSGTVTFLGTSGSRYPISASSGATAVFEPMLDVNGSYSLNNSHRSFTYCDFTRIGSASQPSIRMTTFLNSLLTIDNCTFTTCGEVLVGLTASGGAWNILDTIFTGGVDTVHGLDVRITADNASGSPTRMVNRCVFPLGFNSSQSGASVKNSFLGGGWIDPAGGLTLATELSDSFCWINTAAIAAGGRQGTWSPTDCYFLSDSNTGNHHTILPRVTATYTRVIWDCTADLAGDSSDLLYSATSGVTIDVVNNIVCRNDVAGSNYAAGIFNPNQPLVMKVRHCSGWSLRCFVGPEDDTQPGVVTEYKSNLVVSNGLANHYHVSYQAHEADPTLGAANVLTAAGATHNGSYNLATGAEGGGYNTFNTDGVPGANDIFDEDPGWVDPARNLRKWAIDNSYTANTATDEATVRAAYADAITALTSSLANWLARFPLLMSYVRSGFAPTNAVYANAGHDGVTIGAVEMAQRGGARRLEVRIGQPTRQRGF